MVPGNLRVHEGGNWFGSLLGMLYQPNRTLMVLSKMDYRLMFYKLNCIYERSEKKNGNGVEVRNLDGREGRYEEMSYMPIKG